MVKRKFIKRDFFNPDIYIGDDLSTRYEIPPVPLLRVPGTDFYTATEEKDLIPRIGSGDLTAKTPVSNLTIQAVQDDCNIGIEVQLEFGLVKFPTTQFVYRSPNCIPRTKIPQPDPFPEINDSTPALVPASNCPQVLGIRILASQERSMVRGTDYRIAKQNVEILDIKYPVFFAIPSNKSGYPGTRRGAKITLKVNRTLSFRNLTDVTGAYENGATGGFSYDFTHSYDVWEYSKDFEINPRVLLNYPTTPRYGIHPGYQLLMNPAADVNQGDFLAASFVQASIAAVIFEYPNIQTAWGRDYIENNTHTQTQFGSGVIIQKRSWQIILNCGDILSPPPPPPPPPPKKKCCMCCPNDNKNNNNDQLLRLILKKIGSDDLPATVPNSLAKRNSGTTQIQNLAQFIAYSVKQTNNQIGQFPQEIKIKDADLTQEGNQGKTIKLPNLAESIAEIIGLLLVLQSESNANLIATVNAMIEAGSAKQAAILASDYASANSEFLGYKSKHVEHEVAFTFKPGEQRLDKMLKPGEVKVKGFAIDDKNDLNDILVPLLEMAAMYRAANYRNVGTSDALGKIRDILTGAANIGTALDHLVNNPPPSTDPEAPPPQPKKSDWDSFTEQAETGFISQPGITDNINPYGRKLEQRPKIREFGSDTSEGTSGST